MFKNILGTLLLASISIFADYFPLQIGNWWEYSVENADTHGGIRSPTNIKISIDSSIDSGDSIYFFATYRSIGEVSRCCPIKYDTSYSTIRYLKYNNEVYWTLMMLWWGELNNYTKIGLNEFPSDSSIFGYSCLGRLCDDSTLGIAITVNNIGKYDGFDSVFAISSRESFRQVLLAPGVGIIRMHPPNVEWDARLTSSSLISVSNVERKRVSFERFRRVAEFDSGNYLPSYLWGNGTFIISGRMIHGGASPKKSIKNK